MLGHFLFPSFLSFSVPFFCFLSFSLGLQDGSCWFIPSRESDSCQTSFVYSAFCVNFVYFTGKYPAYWGAPAARWAVSSFVSGLPVHLPMSALFSALQLPWLHPPSSCGAWEGCLGIQALQELHLRTPERLRLHPHSPSDAWRNWELKQEASVGAAADRELRGREVSSTGASLWATVPSLWQ